MSAANSRNREQVKKQEELLDAMGIPENVLRPKYLVTLSYKFRGKKRKTSNEKSTGRKARRSRRCITPGSSNCPRSGR